MILGQLDTYIRIEYPVASTDPNYGQEIITWTTYGYAWAKVDDTTTKNQEKTNSGDTRTLQQPCKVKIRYDNNIQSTWRFVVVEDGRILNLIGKPSEIGRREAMDVMCETYDK